MILVNGKRLGINNGELQDVSQIPAVIVDRIEVLKDGASTLYGFDAMTGVVNITPRKNKEGFAANIHLGQYGEGDGQGQIYDFVAGFVGEHDLATVSAQFTKEDPVWARDRWSSSFRYPSAEKSPPFLGGLSAIAQFGRLLLPIGEIYTLRREAQVCVRQRGLRLERQGSAGLETDLLYSDRDSFAQSAGYPFLSEALDTPISVNIYYNLVGNQSDSANPSEVNSIRPG